MVRDLSQDRKVEVDGAGTARFRTDCDIPLGIRVQPRKPVLYAPDPINAAGNINRFNQLRKWKRRARPKTTNHVVYAVENYKKTWDFFERRLGFLLSDRQTGVGYYSHADGMHEHHNLFLADCTLPGMPGKPGFHHINFGVEDIDELMVGANHMQRAGWQAGLPRQWPPPHFLGAVLLLENSGRGRRGGIRRGYRLHRPQLDTARLGVPLRYGELDANASGFYERRSGLGHEVRPGIRAGTAR